MAGLALALLAPALAQSQLLPPSLFKPEWVLPREEVPASTTPVQLPRAQATKDLSKLTYSFKGQTRTLLQFLNDAQVKSFMVLKNGKIVYELHKFPNDGETLHQSWSMAKQVLSTLVGIALDMKAIRSIDDPMDRYEPRLAANGFAGVTFRQALQMTSGVKYVEEKDRFSLFMALIANRFTLGLAGKSLVDKTLAAELTPAFKPGSRYEYASINSEALKMALEKAVGMPYKDFLVQKLWQPMGMPDVAKILVDREDNAFTFCCLYATTRSYAMLGQLYLQGGQFNGRQIVSADYVRRATTFEGDATNWRASSVIRKDGSRVRGFGYHWWPLEGDRGDFLASGVFGQSVHVLPKQNTVVVRMSSDFEGVEGSSYEATIVGRAVADYLN